MQARGIAGSLRHRLGRPLTWGAILVFGLIWNAARWGLAPDGLDLDGEALAPFAWGFTLLVLAPLPWQWTGDPRPLASPARGLVQALPFGLLCTWILVALLGAGGLPAPMMGHGRMGGHGPHGGMGRGGPRGGGACGSEGGLPGAGLPGAGLPGAGPQGRRTLIAAGAYLSFLVLLGAILARMERAETAEAAARDAADRTRLRALQGQMHPHVFFNAVSGVAELVREDPAGAERALLDMAGLLRQVLDLGERTAHPLAAERQLAERYLALEALRLGRRLQVTWDWDGSLDAQEVPPLVLQPLVENAIKHGIAPERGGGELRIRAGRAGDGLVLEVANTGAPPEAGRPEGVALRNLRERLALLGLDPAAAFALVREGAWTRATLRLPLEIPDHG